MVKWKYILGGVLILTMGPSSIILKSKFPLSTLQVHLAKAQDSNLERNSRLLHSSQAFNRAIKIVDDSVCASSLFKVANRYWNLHAIPQYKNSSVLALKKAQESGNQLLLAKGYLYMGDYYRQNLTLDSALYYYRKSEQIYLSVSDRPNLANININVSEIYFHERDFYKCEIEALNAIRQIGENNDHQKFRALTVLGIVYNELNDSDNALKYLNKAYEIQNRTKFFESENQLAVTLNNIGNVHQKSKRYKISLEYFHKAIVDPGLLENNPLIYSVILDNIAFSKFKLGDRRNEIQKIFKRSIAIKDSLKNFPYVVFSKTRLSEYYLYKGDIGMSVREASEALEMAVNLKNRTNTLFPLQQLIASDPINAAKYSAEYIRINDSLQLAERKNRNKFARIEFETDEIVLEKDKAVKAKWIYFGSAMTALSVMTLIFVIYRQKARQAKLQYLKNQQAANEEIYRLMLVQQTKFLEGRQMEKTRIARDLHDGVMNRLTSTRLNLFVLSKKHDPGTIKTCISYIAGLKNIEEEIRNISHDLNSDLVIGNDGFEQLIQTLFDEQKSVSNAKFHLEMDKSIDWDSIAGTFKINLYRILQEALQNINKHALAKNISVRFKKIDKILTVEMTDDGVGYNVRKVKFGMGLKNITSRTADLSGTVDIQTEKGKGVKIKLAFSV